jgi:hypothetical protein
MPEDINRCVEERYQDGDDFVLKAKDLQAGQGAQPE